jgi:geranylgeranyl reductase family protein
VIIVEEHAQIGNPSCCAGIVGAEGFKELEIGMGRWVIEKLDRATIYPPAGNPVEVCRRKSEALVIDRAGFDRWMASEAVKAGATIFLKTKCVGLKLGQQPTLNLRGETKGKLAVKLVVGADGPVSLVARQAGFSGSEKYTCCAQTEVVGKIPRGTAEIYLSRRFSPGFFGWAIKVGKLCRVGLGCTKGNPVKFLTSFMDEHPVISKKVQPSQTLNFCLGLNPRTFLRKICTKGAILVGDAAGQVKPLTGGGLYMGLSCSKIAAEAITIFMEEKSIEALQRYEREVMKRFGLEVQLTTRARRIFERMSEEDMNQLVKLLEHDDVRGLIERKFDFNRHGKLIQAMLPKAPKILRETGARRLLKYVSRFLK